MASNSTVLDYINRRRTLENSLRRAQEMVERDTEQLRKTKEYCTNCYVQLQEHNDNPPVLTEKQEALYGSRVRP